MRMRNTLLSAGLLVVCLSLGACDLIDSGSDSESVELEGIWQSTVASVSETTVLFLPNGTLKIVEADFPFESCTTGTGTWSLEGTTLVLNIRVDGFSENSKVAVENRGGTLAITVDGETEVFRPVTQMVGCIKYGWGRWQGTLSALTPGGVQDFASNLDIQILLPPEFGLFQIISWAQGPDEGCDGAPGCLFDQTRLLLNGEVQSGGDGALRLGSYDLEGSPSSVGFFQGKYWTDPADVESGFEASRCFPTCGAPQPGASGSFVLTFVEPDRIAGTFLFTGIKANGDALALTQGVVDLTYR